MGIGTDIDGASVTALLDLIYRIPLDPSIWIALCDRMASFSGAVGTGLRATQPELFTFPSLPRSASIAPCSARFFRESWQSRDTRAKGIPFLAQKGFYVDQDFTSESEMGRDPFYTELLEPFDLRWTMAVGFRVRAEWWAACIQRSAKQGPFTHEEQALLIQFSAPLSRACSTAAALCDVYTKGFADSLEAMELGAVAVDTTGRVVLANPSAQRLFGGEIDVTGGRLHATRARSSEEVADLVAYLLTPPRLGEPLESVMLRRPGNKAPLVLHACRLSGRGLSTPVVGSLAGMIVISDLGARRSARCEVLRALYGLTNSEVGLVEQLVQGLSLKDASENLGIVQETARSYLKAIFAKTETHRQGELIALVDRIVKAPVEPRLR